MMKPPEIGLALGGGAVLGAAHIGVLRAVEELDIHVDGIAGTSVGAFIGTLFAFGKGWREIRDIVTGLDWMDISAVSLSQYGLLSNGKLGKTIVSLLGHADISAARIPLAIIATDISSGRKVVLTEGDTAAAVMASTCIPGVYIPVEIGDRMLIDGGISENVPVSPLREMGVRTVIGVNLHAFHSFEPPKHIIDILTNTVVLTMMNITRLQTDQADIRITPDLSGFNIIDTDQIPALIECGYRAARTILEPHAVALRRNNE
ncbi:MAG: patatin-like phospholipase family protein [Deltaproteobacteria bacterium]|nr:patatin-like phospholipase family protein [Candidatus Anaeroferrophillacea bacterium]